MPRTCSISTTSTINITTIANVRGRKKRDEWVAQVEHDCLLSWAASRLREKTAAVRERDGGAALDTLENALHRGRAAARLRVLQCAASRRQRRNAHHPS